MHDVGGGAVEMLGDLGLPEDLVDQVRTMLGHHAEDLENNNVRPIGQGMFGGSDSGAVLGHHASIAQQHVAKSVLQMAAGLRGYRENLAGFVDDLADTDAASASALNGLATSTACVAAPSFETNDACTLPAGGE
jgi:hypothetical protein